MKFGFNWVNLCAILIYGKKVLGHICLAVCLEAIPTIAKTIVSSLQNLKLFSSGLSIISRVFVVLQMFETNRNSLFSIGGYGQQGGTGSGYGGSGGGQGGGSSYGGGSSGGSSGGYGSGGGQGGGYSGGSGQ